MDVLVRSRLEHEHAHVYCEHSASAACVCVGAAGHFSAFRNLKALPDAPHELLTMKKSMSKDEETRKRKR